MANKNKIFPVYSNNAICFGLDNNYAKYFSVVLESFVGIAKSDKKYDLIVLNNDITEYNQAKLKDNLPDNISLRFFNIEETKNKFIDYGKFQPKNYWSESMYYRLLIPELFKNYGKVLYCDSDIIFNDCIDDLFDIDINNKNLLVVLDSVTQELPYDKERKDFLENYLNLKDSKKYFNSGVILFDINSINKESYFKELQNILNEYDKLAFPDQDILNIIFENNVKYISQTYNFQVNIPIYQAKHLPFYDKDFLDDYYKSFNNPKIIHFAGREKPWHEPDLIYYDKFWKIARKTAFYEEIIYKNFEENLKLILNKDIIQKKYIMTKLLLKITNGSVKNKINENHNNLKKQISKIRALMRGNL